MTSTSGASSLDVETRVQDYLNDKLQTTADLNNLDSLLQTIQEQHELLRVQVRLSSAPSGNYWLMNQSSKKPVTFSLMPRTPPTGMTLNYGRRQSSSTNNKKR